MTDGDIDLSYGLDLLRRINKISVDGAPIVELATTDGFALWQFFQNNLLYRDLKSFRTFNTEHPVRAAWYAVPASWLACVILFGISVLGLIQFIFSKKRALFYSVDRVSARARRCDFRLEKVSAFLDEENISYTEIFYAPITIATVKNFLKRKRVAMYLSLFDFILLPFVPRRKLVLTETDRVLFTSEELPRVQALVSEYLRFVTIARWKVSFLTFVFSCIRPRLLLSIDDVRYYQEIIVACRRVGVSSIAFQHGHYTKYHVGWLAMFPTKHAYAYPDTLVVWSTYWKDELIRLGTYFPEKAIVVGGNMREDEPHTAPSRSVQGNMNVIYPYEIDGPRQEIAAFLKTLAACPKVKLFYKLRQDIDRDLQVRAFEVDTIPPDRVRIITFLNEITNGISLVVGSYSTFLYNMIEDRIPVALIPTSSDFGEGIIRNGLADTLASHSGEMCQSVVQAATVDQHILESRAQRLSDGSDRNIPKLLRELIMPYLVSKN